MNQRQAKRLVCDRVARLLEEDTNLMSLLLYSDEMGYVRPLDDHERIQRALDDLSDELHRRAGA